MENQYLIDKNRYDEDVKNGIIPEKTLIEKQVWESTLNRSMVLEAENKQLKDILKEIRGKIHYINIPKNRHNIFDKYFLDKIDEVLK